MLKNSALPLAKSHLGSSDAKLFYFKNLMILRTQLNNFDTHQVKAFVDENDIIKFLVDQVSKVIFSTYEQFYSGLEQKVMTNKIKPEDMSDVMEPDAFFNFLNDNISGIFQAEEDEHITLNDNILDELEESPDKSVDEKA
ncbi:hypothetical protein CJJ09_001897 [Candidozyma auris]|nr:hypothetical protein CJJ09_001897 [[Candida] auris]